MDTFPFSITATGQQPIAAKGNFIRYKEVTNGASASTIRVKTDRGDSLVMDPNDKASLPHTFERITVENFDASATIEGRLIIGEGDFESSQVTGDVNITDRAARLLGIVYGSLGQLLQQTVNGFNALAVKVLSVFNDETTKAGEAFIGYTGQAAVAAQFSHVQVKNPAASGKLLYVDRITVSSGATSVGFNVARYDTDETTAVGAGTNKDAGGAAASGLVKKQGDAAALGTVLRFGFVLANTTLVFDFDPPMRLGEGEGITTQVDTVNLANHTTFEWREKTS